MRGEIVLRRVWILISLGALGVGSVSRVPAQTQDGTFSPLISNTIGLGVEGGYYICHDAHVGAPYLTVLSRVRLGSVLGLEGAVGYRGKQHFSFETPGGEFYSARVHDIPATASVLLFIPLAPSFTPYLLGGVGAHHLILDYSPDLNKVFPDKSKTRFGYHLGFGLEIPINNYVALLGDYRYLHVNQAFENEPMLDFSNFEYKSNSFSAGIMVYF